MELPANLDVSGAEALLLTLRDYDTSHPLICDACTVERLTTPCVQIMLSAKQTFAKHGGSVSFSNPSEAFTDSIESLGLVNELLTKD